VTAWFEASMLPRVCYRLYWLDPSTPSCGSECVPPAAAAPLPPPPLPLLAAHIPTRRCIMAG